MKVALDVDDCIAAWYKAACEFCEVEFKPRNHWCPTESGSFIFPAWEAMKHDEDFWHGLEVLNSVNFEFDYYVTSLPEHLYNSRLNWLRRNGFPDKPLHIATDKLTKALELGIDVIIDDKPSTIIEFIDAGKHAIQYIPPYSTIEPVSQYVTDDFNSIKDILQEIKEYHYVHQT